MAFRKYSRNVSYSAFAAAASPSSSSSFSSNMGKLNGFQVPVLTNYLYSLLFHGCGYTNCFALSFFLLVSVYLAMYLSTYLPIICIIYLIYLTFFMYCIRHRHVMPLYSFIFQFVFYKKMEFYYVARVQLPKSVNEY